MSQSSFIRAQQFKSPLAVVAGILLRSRETQAQRAKRRTQDVRRLKQINRTQQQTIAQAQDEILQLKARLAQLEIENQRLRQQPVTLPSDPPLPKHGYGPKMISLCVNMARRIGLRAVPDVLAMFLKWLDVEAKLPAWTTVRLWMLRVGVAALEEPTEPADDWIWMADHSNQIGPEKVLSIMGLRAASLPPPGQALRHADVRVLHLQVGTCWKREDMAAAYDELAQRCGVPLALVVDGAVELREGAQMCDSLRNRGKNTIVLGDFKHYAANVLKKVVGGSERFNQFSTQMGRARSAIQQTELAHFTPPGPKPKARFMNLAPTLRWAQMVSWQLSHPHTKARQAITAARMNEKLGWLRGFRTELDHWDRCQKVVSVALTFINEQGLFVGAARQLRAQLRPLSSRSEAMPGEPARQVIARLLRFVRQSEAKLAEVAGDSTRQRLPPSTEILESSFGLFKQLQRQHSKGGFTSLLAAYGCLLRPTTPEHIRRAFAEVSVRQVKAWVQTQLGKTLDSRRQTAYLEFRTAP
jgi:hypothetical protein